MQMYRQLRAGGGIMNLAPREKFGLGSKLKKFIRKIIPNEISEIAVKAAPFVAPFNPLLAGAMSGIGSFDQTGRIGQSIKSGLINYGLGQGARFLGGAGIQTGINPFGGFGAAANPFTLGGIQLGSSPFGTQSGIGKLLSEKGFLGTKTLPTDPGIGTDSIFVKPGAEGTTYLPSDFATEALPLETGSITPSGQIVSGNAVQNQAVLDRIAKQTIPGATENVVQKATQRGYGDVFKDIFSGDLNKSASALKELGGKALKTIYTDKDGNIDKLAVASTIAGAANYYEAKKLAEEADVVDDANQYTEAMYEADKQRYKDYYSKILTPESFGLKDGGIISLRKMKANGTNEEDMVYMTDDNSGVMYRNEKGEPITKEEFFRLTEAEEFGPKEIMPKEKPKEMVFKNRMKTLMEARGVLEPESFEYLLEKLKDEMTESGIPSIKLEKKAKGGRVGYAMGSEVPVRQNEAGTKELDYRQSGGFVPPIGIREKADDIPAMLSNNEFVFTADAVRAAGGGSVNKGAQKMYALMKQLEGQVV